MKDPPSHCKVPSRGKAVHNLLSSFDDAWERDCFAHNLIGQDRRAFTTIAYASSIRTHPSADSKNGVFCHAYHTSMPNRRACIGNQFMGTTCNQPVRVKTAGARILPHTASSRTEQNGNYWRTVRMRECGSKGSTFAHFPTRNYHKHCGRNHLHAGTVGSPGKGLERMYA